MAVECRNLLVRCHGGTAALVGVRLKARLLCKDRAETTHEVDVLDAVENAVKKHDRISVDERSSQVEEARAGVAKEMSTCRGRFWKRLVRQRCRVCWTVIRSKGGQVITNVGLRRLDADKERKGAAVTEQQVDPRWTLHGTNRGGWWNSF